MISKLDKILKSRKIQKPKISKNILTFSFFLVLSAFLWLLNTLHEEYVAEIKYEIKLINLPENKIITENISKQITIKVVASGYEIIRKLESQNYIYADASKFARKCYKSADSNKYFITAENLKELIINKTDTKIKIRTIVTDSFFFRMDTKHTKKVPVVPNFKIKYKNGYMQTGNYSILPETIKIIGTDKQLSKINYIETETITAQNVTDSVTKTVNLKQKGNIYFKPEKVTVKIPVGRYTEKSLTVPLKIINIPDTIKIITFPNEIKLTFNIGIDKYKQTSSKDFEVFIDFKTPDNKLPENFKVQIKKQPEGINSIKIYPEFVEYIIKITKKR